MALTVGQTRLRAHPLALLAPLAAVMLGARTEVLALMIGLAAHEAAHLLAAKALGVGVRELRLMPFGGAIQLDNPYALAPARLLAVAAAGPAGSLLAILGAAALAHWRAIPAGLALALIQTNGALLLFNLLPALPLDGGRMLYALLSERVGRARAVEIGVWIGRGVAALLLGATLLSALARGRINLSPALAAVFLLASAGDERRALGDARVRAMLGELQPLSQPLPARVWAVSGDCSARAALRAARADALTLYAIYSGSRLVSFTDDRRLLKAMLERGEKIAVGELGIRD